MNRNFTRLQFLIKLQSAIFFLDISFTEERRKKEDKTFIFITIW